MLQETIVLTALYILVIALLYAPKCPAMTATNPAPDYVDYFPEVVEETDTVTDMVIPIAQTETAIAANPTPDLAALTIRQLKAMAKGKIKNYGNLTKAQLIDRLALA